MTSSSRSKVHVLKPNGAQQAPFADETLCGKSADDNISAMWPGENLRGVHWGMPYVVHGTWCKTCKAAEKTSGLLR